MYVLEPRKSVKNRGELLAECLLGKLDLASVETSYSAYLESRPYLSGKKSLGATQDNIQKLLARWHRLDFLPGSLHFVFWRVSIIDGVDQSL